MGRFSFPKKPMKFQTILSKAKPARKEVDRDGRAYSKQDLKKGISVD